jgi:hypothetical protein
MHFGAEFGSHFFESSFVLFVPFVVSFFLYIFSSTAKPLLLTDRCFNRNVP